MDLVIGVGGVRRNAAIAVVVDGEIQIASEQERFTRTRASRFSSKRTGDVIQHMLDYAQLHGRPISAYASAEDGFAFDPAVRHVRLPHAYAHACASFLPSPFENAAILVCDSGSQPALSSVEGPALSSVEGPEVTVWRGRGGEVTPIDFPWAGPGFTRVYSLATAACGFVADRDEHRLEALARVGGRCERTLPPLVEYADGGLRVASSFGDDLSSRAKEARRRGTGALACLSHDAQEQIVDALVALVADIRRVTGEENICLAGGLFYNTRVNTAVAERGTFAGCFVPPNPGNPGLAIGTALAAAGSTRSNGMPRPRDVAFLGPSYDDSDVKQLLDNCKLTYDYVDDGRLTAIVAEAIARGLLVAWFQGRMECGPRALGHRSILANPLSPHVLANLNTYLKQGDDYRTYGVMLRESDAGPYLKTSRRSQFMEFEAELQDPTRFRPLLPYSASHVRYQTVRADQGRLNRLLEAVGERTGCPVVINTSLNGFHEPIACTPRDAIRIFYGTGLDMLVIGNFVLRK